MLALVTPNLNLLWLLQLLEMIGLIRPYQKQTKYLNIPWSLTVLILINFYLTQLSVFKPLEMLNTWGKCLMGRGMVGELCFTSTVVYTKAIGLTINVMDVDTSNTLTETLITVTSSRARLQVMEFINGLMARVTMVNGLKVSKMDQECGREFMAIVTSVSGK